MSLGRRTEDLCDDPLDRPEGALWQLDDGLDGRAGADHEAILADAELHRLIDVDRPVGLLFIAVLHFVGIDEAPALVARLRDAVPVGSCLAISAVSRDGSDPTTVAVAESMYQNSSASLYVRDHAEVEALFEGFELTEPLADITQWRNPSGTTLPLRALCGVGVKI